MQVIILCGGFGERLREETEFRPKPMIEIGGKPILWHIMKIYSYWGFNDFVLALGYKGNVIREYFLNYEALNKDFTITIGNKKEIVFHNKIEEDDWKITLVDTGMAALKGARIKRVEKYIIGENFMLTYGDGVARINLKELLKFHLEHGKVGTVTSVKPPSRFGELKIKKNMVISFSEKPLMSKGFINGGFFVFRRSFFDYLQDSDDCDFEKGPLEKLAQEGELMAYIHNGFWQCMDTYRDLQLLNKLWATSAPWKLWKD
ncbi:MAG: glucose-1-phosphate cytidylyltransferase [Candidatus Aenigmatarchaeota archaeon]